MQFAQLGIQNTFPNRFNPFVILTLGDSKTSGAASSITTCAEDTLFFWNADTSTVDEVTTQSVANGATIFDPPPLPYGSIWQPYANAYKAAFGRPVYLVNCGKGGSWVSDTGTASNSWGSSGTLRTDTVTKSTDGFAAVGRTGPDLIICDITINDERNGHSTAQINAGLSSFLSWIHLQWPGVDVIFVQQGREETNLNNAALYDLRKSLFDAVNADPLAHMVGQGYSLYWNGGYEADNLHYNDTGNGYLGQMCVNWQLNTGYTKWPRSVMSSMFTRPNETNRTNIENWVGAEVTNGDYFQKEGWYVLKTWDTRNTRVDWSFMGWGVPNATFVVNDCMSFNGTSEYYSTGWVPALYDGRSSVTNIIAGCKVKTNTTTGATVSLFGATDTSPASSFSLVANPQRIRVHDSTLTAGTNTNFLSNTLHTIRRQGTTKELLLNTTSNVSATVANTGLNDTYTIVLAAINSTTITSFWAGEISYFFIAGDSGFSLADMYNNGETYLANYSAQ